MTGGDTLEACVGALLANGAGSEPTQPPPGACLAVAAPSGTAAVVAGHRQVVGVPTALPLTADTRYDVASITKVAATTSTLMTLVEDGQVRLDDPVRRYVPRFRGEGKDEITVRDLFLHRAGLWEWWPAYCEAGSPDEAHRFVERLGLRYPPGQGRHYSDLGFILLGRVVEEATRAGLADAVRSVVLGPLDLTATGYVEPSGAEPAADDGPIDVVASSVGDVTERGMLTSGHPYPVLRSAEDFDGWRRHVLVGEANDGNAFHAFSGVSGHAGLFSTVGDLLRLAEHWRSSVAGGGHWRSRTLQQFVSPGPDDGQALGFRLWSSTVGDCAATAFGHTGFTGMGIAVLPRHGASVVLATNRLHVNGTPAPCEAMWQAALTAAHRYVHDVGPDRHESTACGTRTGEPVREEDDHAAR